jgi:hypothetical protein
VMASGGKRSKGEAHPYLGFEGCWEAAARPRNGDLLLGSAACGEDGISVILRSRRGAGWHQGASMVLLGLVVELGRLRIDLAVVGLKVSDGSVWCS